MRPAAVEPDVEPPSAIRLSLMPTPFKPQQLYHKNDIHKTSQTVFSDLLLPCACAFYASGQFFHFPTEKLIFVFGVIYSDPTKMDRDPFSGGDGALLLSLELIKATGRGKLISAGHQPASPEQVMKLGCFISA